MIGGAKGIGIGIDFGIPNQYCRATSKPYIEKDVLDSLRVVTSAYGKSNNDADRSIVKNLVDASNPFVIRNAAFKLNSGFGEYSADFESFDWAVNISQKQHNKATISLNGRLCNHTAIEVDEMKVNIIGNVTELIYWYIANPDDTTRSEIRLTSGINTLPKSYAKDDGQTYNIGFAYISGDSEITIEQIPSFEGAFVTDGIDDLITSTKTVQEMGITDEVTVVSMIHQIDKPSNFITTNNIRTSGSVVGRNAISLTDKTGIYGWYKDNIQGSTINVINNILGDKADYTASASSNTNLTSKFSVVGYISNDSIVETSQVAWYWTIIANKVLTTDQINQVIAYFNLDRTLKPDILCDVKKQGITNDNHAEFGDKLIDFSGNGRDIQLNNIAWKGDSGIGKYETDFTTWTRGHFTDEVNFTPSKIEVTGILTTNSILINNKPTPIYNVEIHSPNKSIVVYYQYNDDTGVKRIALVDGINELPSANDSLFVTSDRLNSKGITITQIPSHAGALCLDGINDFGKVINMPIYKDYTIIIDYIRTKININTESGSDACVLSKSKSQGVGAFMFNLISGNREDVSYSFGRRNIVNIDNTIRAIYYQSKYINNGQNIDIESTVVDSDKLWLGTFRDNDSRFLNGAIYFLMSFPYSMSEFLIERQLKKHKLGTLYPDMVEFRPVIKSSVEYASISYLLIIPGQGTVTPVIGQYYPILSTDTSLVVYVATNGVDEVANLTINGQEPTSSSIHVDGRFKFEFPFNNSPQKINITIDEYIRYEDIKQPYPVIFQIKDRNTSKKYNWGDKIKVGSSIQLIQGENSNLLNGLYSIRSYEYEGKAYSYNQLTNLNITVTKQSISLSCNKIWLLDNNEPKCILSPRLLRIPNSSYKILGYIPDISGHSNHGVIHNSAYGEGSGVNEDGSYQFDGVDDFVTIPTTVGGKQMLMKVNWQKAPVLLYDQRASGSFAVLTTLEGDAVNSRIAYQGRNPNGKTYIDGIENNNIETYTLKDITHNITIVNSSLGGVIVPVIGCNTGKTSNFAKMSLYDFMLFDEISTDDKILELNEYVGIQGNVWRILTQLSNSTLISNETLIKNE